MARSVARASVLFALSTVIWLAAGCNAIELPWESASPDRIVLIVIDTLRQDYVSAYGARDPTPNIDALAAGGQLFPNVVSSSYQTTMSMSSLFTRC